MTCRGFLKSTLKLINSVLALVGVAMILYSIWMLKKWHSHTYPPPSASPAPSPPEDSSLSSTLSIKALDDVPAKLDEAGQRYSKLQLGYGHDVPIQLGRSFLQKGASDLQFRLLPKHLPAPWFIYTFLGIGIIVCVITCSGHIAAETTNGCCLSCYTVFVCFLIVAEAGVAAFVFLNHHWEQDIPEDPTGQLDNIKSFVQENFEICKWVGLVVVVVQALAVLFALILRALGPAPRGSGYDSDDDYLPSRSGLRQPLINRQASQAAVTSTAGAEARSSRSDAWTTRMREKYGLDTTEFTYNPMDSKRFPNQGSTSAEENSRRCTVM